VSRYLIFLVVFRDLICEHDRSTSVLCRDGVFICGGI
jgi:hypothetical protein